MDTNAFNRKAIYSHVLAATLDGQVETIARWLVANGFQAIWPKVADGAYIYRWRPPFTTQPYKENLTAGMVEIFHSYGLAVIGWGFLYGKNPTGEATIAAMQIRSLKLDGYVLDAEGSFDTQPTAVANACAIPRLIRRVAPDVPLAYCGWPRIWNPRNNGEWHPAAVAKAFMADCDVASPMAYWEGDDPAWVKTFLQQSYEQYRRFTDKPFIPAGRAYTGDGGKATPATIAAFQAKADELNLPGLSWWFLDHAVKQKEIGAALKETHPYSTETQPQRTCPTCGQVWP